MSVLFSKKADPRSFIRDRADKRKPPAQLNEGQGGILAATPAYERLHAYSGRVRVRSCGNRASATAKEPNNAAE